jgi:AcrR family transcriptional regulator
MDQRALILVAAESLLNASADGEISTRAIAEAAGVGGPVLYRHFGDKNGLLRALVDFGFDRYLSIKRAAALAENPVDNLRNGWDTHITFALDHPAVYRLMYSPTIGEMPSAAGEALHLLRGHLELCAEAGFLRVDVDAAAQRIMSANVGVALSLISQPSTYQRATVSDAVRDAIHRSLLVEPSDTGARPPLSTVPTVATQLAALTRADRPGSLSDAELALLHEWLARLSQA